MSTSNEPYQKLIDWSDPPAPPLNLYGVISLVGALLGLFPVAVVFGLLAFTRPSGRGLAIAGLVLGLLEISALVLILTGLSSGSTNDSDTSARAVATTVAYSEHAQAPTSAEVTGTSSSVRTAPSAAERAPSVSAGSYCNQSDLRARFADGSTAFCSRLAGTDAYVWSEVAGVAPNPTLAPAQPVAGAPCSPYGATAEDNSLFCTGGTWATVANPNVTVGSPCEIPGTEGLGTSGEGLRCAEGKWVPIP